MTRPASLQDVLALVRRGKVVGEDRLHEFLQVRQEASTARSSGAGVAELAPAAVLSLMVEQGMLTGYQAAEVAAGRCEFWIGGYHIVDLLGRGGMGQVYLAEHTLLGKRVALKVLTGGDRSDESARERFLHEARAAAALDHPNIVRVFDVNVASDPPFLVMEFIDGISLQAAVARYGTFPTGEAAAVGMEVAKGLQQASEVGLVHRDIKPANILIDRRGGVKILDLGIARFNTDPISRLTDSQTVIGTLDYLAPEQAVDSSLVDSRADLYSLGTTIFFLLAGHPPFADDKMGRKIIRKQQSDPPSIEAMRLDIPRGLAQVINRLLARSASDRYPTPAEAAAAFKPWAAPGTGFPERLFQPRQTAEDTPGQSTATDNDPSPTPLPPTRRMLRTQIEPIPERRTVLLDTTPYPPVRSPDSVAFVLEIPEDESGATTVTLLPASTPKRWSKLWRVGGIVAAAVIGTALLSGIVASFF